MVLTATAMAALGVPTTRSLALLTHEPNSLPVLRENGPEPPSLLARTAPSFIRIGHFQALNPGPDGQNSRPMFFGGGGGWMRDQNDYEEEEVGNMEGLRDLMAWCKDEIMGMKGSGVKEWFQEVVRRNAEMVAGWQVSICYLPCQHGGMEQG